MMHAILSFVCIYSFGMDFARSIQDIFTHGNPKWMQLTTWHCQKPSIVGKKFLLLSPFSHQVRNYFILKLRHHRVKQLRYLTWHPGIWAAPQGPTSGSPFSESRCERWRWRWRPRTTAGPWRSRWSSGRPPRTDPSGTLLLSERREEGRWKKNEWTKVWWSLHQEEVNRGFLHLVVHRNE